MYVCMNASIVLHYNTNLFVVVAMEDKIGNFEEGKEFDALLIDLAVNGSPVDLNEQVRDIISIIHCRGTGVLILDVSLSLCVCMFLYGCKSSRTT